MTDFLLGLMRAMPINELNFVMNVSIIALLWFGGKALIEHLTALTEQVRRTNGRMTKAESWQVSHDKQDDERHDEVRERQREIIHALEAMRQ